MKIISFKNYKHWYLIHPWSDTAFKGTVVNRALPFLHGGQGRIHEFIRAERNFFSTKHEKNIPAHNYKFLTPCVSRGNTRAYINLGFDLILHKNYKTFYDRLHFRKGGYVIFSILYIRLQRMKLQRRLYRFYLVLKSSNEPGYSWYLKSSRSSIKPYPRVTGKKERFRILKTQQNFISTFLYYKWERIWKNLTFFIKIAT